MNMALILSAVRPHLPHLLPLPNSKRSYCYVSQVHNGATVANYVSVTALLKDEAGKLRGARVRDELNGEEWEVKAKVRIFFLNGFTHDHPTAYLECTGYHQRNRTFLRRTTKVGRPDDQRDRGAFFGRSHHPTGMS